MKRLTDQLKPSAATGAARRFFRDSSGNAALIACFGLPAVLISAAAAISYSNEYNVRSSLQNAVDAAVLAGATEIGAGEPVARAERVFNASLTDTVRAYATDIKPKFSVRNDTITGQVRSEVENVFAGVLGERAIASRSDRLRPRLRPPSACWV